MRKIKKGDDVIIISGKDKGKRGSVSRVLPQSMILERFHLGSTVVLVSTRPDVKLMPHIELEASVKLGQPIMAAPETE